MNLMIRADASVQIGTGHVMRCLALAQAWQDMGGTVYFVLAETVPALELRLQNEGIKIVHLPTNEPGSVDDAAKTAQIAKLYHVDWVVVDGYHFCTDYQYYLKKDGFRLLFLDDNVHTKHYYADLVLNQNIYAQAEMYSNREAYTKLLLGTKYALLRREFWPWRKWQREQLDTVQKVLVTMGGSDPENVTSTVVRAFKKLSDKNLEVAVVVGGSNPYWEQIKEEAKQTSISFSLIHNSNKMAKLMAWADLAVSAGGSSCWELAFMGLPTLLIILTDNQTKTVNMLAQEGVFMKVGHGSSLTVPQLQQSLECLFSDLNKRTMMYQRSRQLVDGYGASRVIKSMLQTEFEG